MGAAQPLGPLFKDDLKLSSFQQALLVAVPVVVGSIGRIPVGALTDRFGGRVLFPLVTVATIVPVLFLGLVGHSSLAALLVGGFFLGIGGTAFAVGVPFVNAWFPPERRGFAIGIFGMGMGGTAISALTTVRLVHAGSVATPFIVTALALAAYAVLAAVLLRDAPGRTVPKESLGARLAATARLPITWHASAPRQGRALHPRGELHRLLLVEGLCQGRDHHLGDQQTDYPSAGPDRPEYEPHGCPRGAAFSWYTYSPTRVRYPYVRGVRLQLYREAKARTGDPVHTSGGAQVLDLAPAQGGFVELTFPEPGQYPFVDHDMCHAENGAHGSFSVVEHQ